MILTTKTIQELRKTLLKDFGTRCKSFSISCAGCQAYLAYDILEELYRSLPKPKLPKNWGKISH